MVYKVITLNGAKVTTNVQKTLKDEFDRLLEEKRQEFEDAS